MGKVLNILVFLLVIAFSGNAQTALQQKLDSLKTGAELPETLQSTRTAVFLKFNQTSQTDTIDWYETAVLIHERFMEMYIDAVAYYRWRDLNAGYDATRSYLESLAEREINQVIIVELTAMSSCDIYIVPTNLEDPELLDTSTSSWHIRETNLENARENLAGVVRRTDLERGNFLISNTPEFFYDTRIFVKNRFESFQPDLKLDKLAAPLFFGSDTEQPEHPWDQELTRIMNSQYPFSYEIVSAGMTEDLMQKAGFHYVLRYLHAEEKILKTLLDYSSTEEPIDGGLGYKFYVKHLITGDIYLGDDWDSRPDWQQALMVHLTRLRRALKVE